MVGQLVQWTIQKSYPPWARKRQDGKEPYAYEWSREFFEWCGALCVFLTMEEIKETITSPIRSTYEEFNLCFTAYFMCGLVKNRFPQQQEPTQDTIELWQDIAKWIFTHPKWERCKDLEYMCNEYNECVGLVIFTHLGFPLLDTPWPGLPLVRPLIERWVEQYGTHPSAFYKLLIFLENTGWEWCPDPAINWIESIFEKVRENRAFWDKSDNGGKAAKLLYRIWRDKKELFDNENIKRLVRISDLLTDKGIRLAYQIQQEIKEII